jgi:hypothetical protein
VPEQVEAEDAMTAPRELLRERPVHPAGEEQTGKQQDRSVAYAVLVEHQAVPLKPEITGCSRHREASIPAHLPERPGVEYNSSEGATDKEEER